VGATGVPWNAQQRALDLLSTSLASFGDIPTGTAGFADVGELLTVMAGRADTDPPVHAVFVPD
jgi:hypothetical protein